MKEKYLPICLRKRHFNITVIQNHITHPMKGECIYA